MRAKRTTGLSTAQFADLIDLAAEEVDHWDLGNGRPRALPFTKALKATVMYFKDNITQKGIAELL